jgi:quercetin 2,3-dioxygenase
MAFPVRLGEETVIEVRLPETIHQAHGEIENGTFRGRWHFSFDEYMDPKWVKFGQLRVFNDDTLSPGATWPLHPHRHNEVVTYVAGGEFRHEDDRGRGGVLTQGGVQHTTVGRGMSHAEINNRPDLPMRFIQMWFLPERLDLDPAVEQKQVSRTERTNGFLPLVSSRHKGALPLRSDASVFSSYLETGRAVSHPLERGRGAYLYVLEGGPVRVNGRLLPDLAAAELADEPTLRVAAEADAELLLVDTRL